jgi:single-strand DNA-binding protein
VNKVILSGRWTKDIDFKTFDSGKCVSKSSLAVDDGFGDKKQTYFFDCEAWGKTAEVIANYSGKGKKILVEGRLKVESWEKDGQKRYATKVVIDNVELIESKDSSQKQTSQEPQSQIDDSYAPPMDDSDLPF